LTVGTAYRTFPDAMMTPVRLRVRELREAQKISQVALAELAGIRRATLSAIETGQTKGVDFDTLDRLARALGVDAALLIVQEPAKKRRGRG
jgi:transcriptional regulator with XRE-family HTH domain